MKISSLFKFQTEQEIREYFKQFGDVNDVEMHDVQSGFVVFKTAEAAETALSCVVHRVGNCDMEVKEAEPWYQPDHILNVLDDDCLQNIFKYLKPYHLTNASEVCTRFNQLAKDVFKAKFKRLEVDNGWIYGERYNYFVKMLRTFGSSIRSLSIRSWDNHQNILQVINEHTSSQLKALTLYSFRIDEHVNINSMLSNLETLELISCDVYSFSDILTVCTELKILKIKYMNFNRLKNRKRGILTLPLRPLNQRFAKLEEIHLESLLDEHDLNSFLTLDSPLKKLVVLNYSPTRSLAPVIIKHHENLEELVLYQRVDENVESSENFQKQLQCFSQPLRSLKILKLEIASFSVGPFIKMLAIEKVPVEELVLRERSHGNQIDSNEIYILTQLKKLKSVKLFDIDCFTDEHLIQLAKELPQLQRMVLYGLTSRNINVMTLKKSVMHATKLTSLILEYARNLSIDVKVYGDMLKAVQNRSDEINLSINISGRDNVISVDDETLSKNRKWLQINTDFQFDDNESYATDDCYGSCTDDDDDSDEIYTGMEYPYGYHDELGHYQIYE